MKRHKTYNFHWTLDVDTWEICLPPHGPWTVKHLLQSFSDCSGHSGPQARTERVGSGLCSLRRTQPTGRWRPPCTATLCAAAVSQNSSRMSQKFPFIKSIFSSMNAKTKSQKTTGIEEDSKILTSKCLINFLSLNHQYYETIWIIVTLYVWWCYLILPSHTLTLSTMWDTTWCYPPLSPFIHPDGLMADFTDIWRSSD